METPQETRQKDATLTVYFDGSCTLCTAEINHYARQKGASCIHFVDVSSDTADIGPDLSTETAMRRFHVRQADGTLLSGAKGFIAIWQVLPRWRLAAKLARLPGIPMIMEVGYRLFLPVRPLLSKVAAALGARAANECACKQK